MRSWSLSKQALLLSLLFIAASFFSPFSVRFTGQQLTVSKHAAEAASFSINAWKELTVPYHFPDIGPIKFHEDLTNPEYDDNPTTVQEKLTAGLPLESAIQEALETGDSFFSPELDEVGDLSVTVSANADLAATSTPEGDPIAEGYKLVRTEINFTPTAIIPDGTPADAFDQGWIWVFYKLKGEPDSGYQFFGKKETDEDVDGDGDFFLYFTTVLPQGYTYEFTVMGLYYYKDGEGVPNGRLLPHRYEVEIPGVPVVTEEEAGAATAEDTGFVVEGKGTDAQCIYWDDAKFQVSLAGCFAQFFQRVAFPIASGLMYLAGRFFDVLAAFTLNSTSYSEPSFITTGWTLVRDFSNILFIVALVYLAFGVIFDLHSVNVKKSIASIIIMALLVNFSLFFTKVIIDTSNILARIFYSQIEITGVEDLKLTEFGEKSISRGVISGIDPQLFISPESQLKLQAGLGSFDRNRALMIIYLMATLLTGVAAWAFFVTGLNFVQRTLSLWLSLIFAPFAFVSFAFPFGLKNLKKVGWSSWIKDLLCWCFFAPLFMFFIYLIITFADSDFLKSFISNASSYGAFEFLIYITFPFVVLMTLLIYAKNLAKSLGCDGADAFVGMGTKAVAGIAGAGVMVASGGLAYAGRNLIGSRYQKDLNNEDLKKRASEGDKSAIRQLKTAQYMTSATFDPRKTKMFGAIAGATGMNMNTGSGIAKALTLNKVGFNTADTAGGFRGVADRKSQKEIEFFKSLGHDHHTAKKITEEIKQRKETGGTPLTDPLTGRPILDAAGNQVMSPGIEQMKRNKENWDEEVKSGEKEVKKREKEIASLQADLGDATLSGADAAIKRARIAALRSEITTHEAAIDAKKATAKDGLTYEQTDKALLSENRAVEKLEKSKSKAEKSYLKLYAENLEKKYGHHGTNTTSAQALRSSWNNGSWRQMSTRMGLNAGSVIGRTIDNSVGRLTGTVQGLFKRNDGFIDMLKQNINQGGALKEAVRGNIQEAAEGHFHPHNYKDTYKPVMTGLAKFFEGLAKGGIEIKGGHGGGGGHKKDDHGHGGGDHGGGGGHH